MQDHAFGHRAAVGPGQVEHLDLATAELRCRIAGIGLAIAELREETGRLRASAGELIAPSPSSNVPWLVNTERAVSTAMSRRNRRW